MAKYPSSSGVLDMFGLGSWGKDVMTFDSVCVDIELGGGGDVKVEIKDSLKGNKSDVVLWDEEGDINDLELGESGVTNGTKSLNNLEYSSWYIAIEMRENTSMIWGREKKKRVRESMYVKTVIN